MILCKHVNDTSLYIIGFVQRIAQVAFASFRFHRFLIGKVIVVSICSFIKSFTEMFLV